MKQDKPQFDKRWIKMATEERFKTKPASDKAWWELLPPIERAKAEAWILANGQEFKKFFGSPERYENGMKYHAFNENRLTDQ